MCGPHFPLHSRMDGSVVVSVVIYTVLFRLCYMMCSLELRLRLDCSWHLARV